MPAPANSSAGRSISLGPVAGLLADSWADLESAATLTYRAAELAKDDPLAHLEHSSLAKLAATEACCRIVDRCVQVMGRWGIIRDSQHRALLPPGTTHAYLRGRLRGPPAGHLASTERGGRLMDMQLTERVRHRHRGLPWARSSHSFGLRR